MNYARGAYAARLETIFDDLDIEYATAGLAPAQHQNVDPLILAAAQHHNFDLLILDADIARHLGGSLSTRLRTC